MVLLAPRNTIWHLIGLDWIGLTYYDDVVVCQERKRECQRNQRVTV